MPIQHQWDWLFAFGTIFAALDAFNIGANDVANSFATSVAAKSLTLRQACCIAAVCEFLGGILVGAKVSGTIKNGIINLSLFQNNAGVEILGFVCALTASATWLMIATKNCWPVSTTYSIVSALAGVGVAVGGKDAVQWGWNDAKGLGAIFAGFVLAPSIAAGFAGIVFLITKYAVLKRKDSTRAALIASPIYFFTVSAVCCMSIVYKGSPSLHLDKLPETTIAAAIVGTGAVIAALSLIFWLPYVYCKVVRHDYTIRFYHFFFGPALWWREAPADAEEVAKGNTAVPDYRVYQDENDVRELPMANATGVVGAQDHSPTASHHHSDSIEKCDPNEDIEGVPRQPQTPRSDVPLSKVEDSGPAWKTLEFWKDPMNPLKLAYKTVTHGTTIDIHAVQKGPVGSKEADRLAKMHASAVQYDNKTEHLYSFLQVLTACTASFAHGANDLANAIGPFSAIYSIWHSGDPLTKNTPTETWQLAFGGAMLVIGLSTYGYNIMAVLGNKMTLMSPSRGFSMELGSTITVLLASQYGIPVSSTMCITGATLGVALCNGDLRAFNWRQLGWILLGWILTIPVAGLSAGCLMGILLNAPSF